MLWSDHSQGAHTLAALTHLQKPKYKMALEKQLPMCESLRSGEVPSLRIHSARVSLSWALCKILIDWLQSLAPLNRNPSSLCKDKAHGLQAANTKNKELCVWGWGYFHEWKDLLLHMQPCFKERWEKPDPQFCDDPCKSELTSIDHNGALRLARSSYVCQDHHELQSSGFQSIFTHTHLLEVHKIQLTEGILSCLGLFLFCGRILLSCSGWPWNF